VFNKEKTNLVRYPSGKAGGYVIPANVTQIGEGAFEGSAGLTNVTIPESVKIIEVGTFKSCSSLVSITIPSSAQSIEPFAFEGCTSLTSITIPASITNIASYAFYACTNLANIYFKGNVPVGASDGSVFARCNKATVYYRPGTTGWGPTFGGRPTAVWQDASADLSTAKESRLADGLIAWWKADGDALDSAGTHHGILHNVTFEEGKYGRAFYINGAPQSYVSVSRDLDLTGTANAFTIALWTRPQTLSSLHAFMGCDDGGGDYNKWIFWSWEDRLQFHVNVAKTGGRYIGEGVFKLTTNQWHHIAVVKNGPAFRFYGDGKEVWSDACAWLGNIPPTHEPLTIGKAEGFGFKGLLDDIRIYNRALSSNEVASLYGDLGDTITANTSVTMNLYPFSYTTNNGAITITKYTGPGGEVVIPKEINGRSVVVVQDAAFFYCRKLTSIMLPKSVTSIGGGAFAFCDSLTSIEVDPANPSYRTVDGVLFNSDKTCLVCCPAGKTGSYAIPSSVKNIGDCAFGGWSKLSSVTIPNGVTNIGQFAFDSFGNLTSLAIPESVVSIGTGAFQCGGLKTVAIPKATTSIASHVFRDGHQLKTISVDRDNPAYCSVDGTLFDKGRTRLISYPGGKAGSYQVPDRVDEINPAAFNGCAFLPSVTLPASVTRVGHDAFTQCGDLTAVYFNGNAPWVDGEIFADSKKVTVYYRPGTKGWGPTFAGRATAVWKP